MPILISFSGLPGVGKTTIAKALTQQIPALYLRVDVVESALRESALQIEHAEDAGYRAICGIAVSNLKLGQNVIADTVNPVPDSRRLWTEAAKAADADLINIEIICTDIAVHQARVETRSADLHGHPLPTWAQVQARVYHPWSDVDLRLDSSKLRVEDCVQKIMSFVAQRPQPGAM
ncbi:MAG: AAA family ATPase [Pseudomonadota bacterium]